MKHLDLSVSTEFSHPMCALEKNGLFKTFQSRPFMIAEFTETAEYKRRAHQLYEDLLHPTIAEFSVWCIDNFVVVVKDLGYEIIRAQQSLKGETDERSKSKTEV